MRKTSARLLAGSLVCALGLQLLPGCAATPKTSGGGPSTTGGPPPSGSGTGEPASTSTPPASPTPAPPTSPTPAPSAGTGNKPRSRISTAGVERATLMGFMFGSPFGLIGAGAGAILGFIYGNLAMREDEKKAEVEAQRQEATDADMERQIDEQKAKESAPEGGSVSQGRKQGVIVVKDHLADRPPGPPTGSAAGPSGSTPSRGTPRPADAVRAALPEADAEGFRPVYEGGRLVRRERDPQGDGRPDTILHYDANGQLVRREDSSRLDGRMDLWTHYVEGKVVRKESDTHGTGQVDLWIHYDDRGNVARAEALIEKDVKLTQIFVDGRVAREEWRRHPGGQLSAVAVHQDGKVVQREEDSTGQGRLDLVSVFDPDGRLVKQGRRADEGWLMSWRHFDAGGRVVREEELGKNGEVVTVSFFEDGRLTRKELYVLDEETFRGAPRVPDAPGATEG